MLAILTVVLLALHLLAVNVASCGPLPCIWLHRCYRRGDTAAGGLGRRLAILSLAALVVGMLLGAALIGLAGSTANGDYWQALGRLPTRAYVFAGSELLFSLVCLLVYVATWNHWLQRPWLHGSVALLSVTNLLYHFPPLMIVLGDLAVRPELIAANLLTRDQFRTLIVRPDVLSQTIHFAVASVAVSGAALMMVAMGRKSRESRVESQEPSHRETEPGLDRYIKVGAWIALAASLVQLAVGLWVLVALPTAARDATIGGDLLATAMFLAALVATFAMLHLLAAVAFGDTSRRSVLRGALAMIAVVLLMVGSLDRMRARQARGLPDVGAQVQREAAARPAG